MFELILQLHAHKKGSGSTHNGRDSNAQRLGTKPSWAHLKAEYLLSEAAAFPVPPAAVPRRSSHTDGT